MTTIIRHGEIYSIIGEELNGLCEININCSHTGAPLFNSTLTKNPGFEAGDEVILTIERIGKQDDKG